ncbi:DNA polymerase III subunit epsilon [Fodinicurvata sp. EGI_FJ10296]|uniref:DNA polymerase III subunit epsilon n=1 Tax=Fodinicurvata sp. EGI_FJ10296 TaxID=3231908 RepID=UPI00345290BF
MREIVMDTETTGLDPHKGDRLVEIGGVELLNLVPTGRTYHVYINPERPMSEEAFAVHGLGDDFLSGQPTFAQVASDFLDFIADANLVIHNADFDIGFLNMELKRVGHRPIRPEVVIDTLAIARKRYPGAQATLDALCRRYGIDNANRTLHGALLDSELLAEVYLELRGGRQPGLTLTQSGPSSSRDGSRGGEVAAYRRHAAPRPPRRHEPTAEEIARHEAFIDTLKDPLWRAVSAD